MDYSCYPSQPQQLQYNSMSGQIQHMYPGHESGISPDDAELFRGLANIGNSFDTPYSQFTPATTNFTPRTQQENSTTYPPRQQSLSGSAQPPQPPKSLSPESSQDGSMLRQRNVDAPQHQLHGLEGTGVDATVTSLGFEQERSSSEDKDLNILPVQDRRKAQNRAAQRAFRERKEKHVKELEAKLESMNQASSKLQSDNERLKRELAAISTQNEILRATHQAPPGSSTPVSAQFQHSEFHAPRVATPTSSTPSISPTEFVVATGGEAKWPLKFEVYPNQRGRMLLAGAAWDLIVRDPRVAQGKIDLEEVCQRLKGKAKCDGRGPAFQETEIRQVLDECAVGSNDLL